MDRTQETLAAAAALPIEAGSTLAIRVRGLSKRFGAHRGLDGVDLEVADGEMLVVLGPSGSGKTTLLRILAGLVHPDVGEVRLHGRDATRLPPQRRGYGVVFQEQALFQRMTVERNISFGLELNKLPAAQIRKVVDEMLDLIRLQQHRKKYPAQFRRAAAAGGRGPRPGVPAPGDAFRRAVQCPGRGHPRRAAA